VRRTLALFLVLGCADASDEAEPIGCPLGAVPFEGQCVAPSSDGKFDLPNHGVMDRFWDGGGYATITAFFKSKGFDLTADVTKLDAGWPTGSATVVMQRYGTPVMLAGYGYIHTALDVMRPAVTDSTDALAPVSGTAFVFDWSGNPGYHGNPYAGVVGIWDPKSHLIMQLMHIEPTAEIIAHGQSSFEVTKGDVIGKLALPPIVSENAERFRHTHVDIVDGANLRALDPARYLPYQDHVAPTLLDLYTLDAAAKQSQQLTTGKLDVVVEMSDRDDHTGMNFEVNAIEYSIAVDGVVILAQPACELDHLFEKVTDDPISTRVLQMIDFGNAAAQVTNVWPRSDTGNPDKTFRYALTQLAVVNGRCTVKNDADGFIDVPASAKKLTATITAWDANGNATTATLEMER
jgi:hypothetical protein